MTDRKKEYIASLRLNQNKRSFTLLGFWNALKESIAGSDRDFTKIPISKDH